MEQGIGQIEKAREPRGEFSTAFSDAFNNGQTL
jgi:hypothetical protein